MYVINGWIGFCTAQDEEQLKKIFKRGVKYGIWSKNDDNYSDILGKRSKSLFNEILSNPQHVLRHLLCDKKSTKYELHNGDASFVLPFLVPPHDMCNFII